MFASMIEVVLSAFEFMQQALSADDIFRFKKYWQDKVLHIILYIIIRIK